MLVCNTLSSVNFNHQSTLIIIHLFDFSSPLSRLFRLCVRVVSLCLCLFVRVVSLFVRVVSDRHYYVLSCSQEMNRNSSNLRAGLERKKWNWKIVSTDDWTMMLLIALTLPWTMSVTAALFSVVLGLNWYTFLVTIAVKYSSSSTFT